MFKQNNLDKRVYVFIAPVAKPYMDLILKRRYESYSKWLKETVEVFDHILVYPYPNNLSNSYLTKFIDNRHYTPTVGQVMVNSMFGGSDGNHIVLNRDNLEIYLDSLDAVKMRVTSIDR